MSPLDAAIWVVEFLLILAGFLLVVWLSLKGLFWLGNSVIRAPRFFSGLSNRDWLFLTPVFLALLYWVLIALGIAPKSK
jgi:hypothetical protein